MNTATAARPTNRRVVVEAVSLDMAVSEALIRRASNPISYRVVVEDSAITGYYNVVHVSR